jgi:protein TonB
MPVSPSLHLCLHADPGAVLGTARPAERDEDPAAELAAWVRNDAVDARGLDGRRIAGAAASMGLHIAALALLISAAAPNLPIAMGESEVDVLEIEFLAPAPEIAPVVHASPPVAKIGAKPAPVELPPRTKPEPVAPELAPPMPIPEPVTVATRADIIEPVTEPPTPATTASPAREAVTPATAPEQPLSARGKRAQSQYLRELMAWLARHRVYPVEAKKHKLEGVVQVRFAIDRDGHLLSATVHRSAGAELLDQAALDVLRRADPMPKFPRALERSRLSVTLPIDFSLITD